MISAEVRRNGRGSGYIREKPQSKDRERYGRVAADDGKGPPARSSTRRVRPEAGEGVARANE